jgi:hypothetical protein
MTTPTDTQSLILSRAATRPDSLALPLPDGLVGAAAKLVVGKMIACGWLQEVEANLCRGEPMWRETGDGHGTTLVATEAGLEAIGIEPVVAGAVAKARKVKPKMEPVPTADSPNTTKPLAIRTGTKQAQIIALLQRPEGATVAEICAVTGWLAHTARGMISGGMKKKLGLAIVAGKELGRGMVYRL